MPAWRQSYSRFLLELSEHFTNCVVFCVCGFEFELLSQNHCFSSASIRPGLSSSRSALHSQDVKPEATCGKLHRCPYPSRVQHQKDLFLPQTDPVAEGPLVLRERVSVDLLSGDQWADDVVRWMILAKNHRLARTKHTKLQVNGADSISNLTVFGSECLLFLASRICTYM